MNPSFLRDHSHEDLGHLGVKGDVVPVSLKTVEDPLDPEERFHLQLFEFGRVVAKNLQHGFPFDAAVRLGHVQKLFGGAGIRLRRRILRVESIGGPRGGPFLPEFFPDGVDDLDHVPGFLYENGFFHFFALLLGLFPAYFRRGFWSFPGFGFLLFLDLRLQDRVFVLSINP